MKLCNFAACELDRADGLRQCFKCEGFFHHVCCIKAGCEEDARAFCARCLNVEVFAPSPRVQRRAQRACAADLAKTPEGMKSTVSPSGGVTHPTGYSRRVKADQMGADREPGVLLPFIAHSS